MFSKGGPFKLDNVIGSRKNRNYHRRWASNWIHNEILAKRSHNAWVHNAHATTPVSYATIQNYKTDKGDNHKFMRVLPENADYEYLSTSQLSTRAMEIWILLNKYFKKHNKLTFFTSNFLRFNTQMANFNKYSYFNPGGTLINFDIWKNKYWSYSDNFFILNFKEVK